MKTRHLLKCIFPVIMLIFFCTNSMAQWSQIHSLYGGILANDGAFAFSLNNRPYVGGGSQSDSLYAFDSSSNSWESKGVIPADMGHAFSMFFTINDTAYVVGGDSAGYSMKAVWMYEPVANAWTRKGDFPSGERNAGFAFSLNGYGYVGGGFGNASIYSDIWKYDPANDQWSLLPNDLPITGIAFPSCFTIGSKAYVLTGGTMPSGVNEVKSMWEFDPVTTQWTSRADFPGAGRQAALAFSNNLYGYLGGGQSNYTTNYTDMWRYDAAGNSWMQVENLPLLGTAWATAIAVGNSAYVGLGAKFVGSGLVGVDSFFKYKMSTTTAIETVANSDNEWFLYPNPATEQLYLSGDIDPKAEITILDMAGRAIRQPKGDYRALYIGDLAQGTYSVKITSKETSSYRRFTKQ
jgi:hypothetical protein